jgi:hypothetical protein
MSQTGVKVGVSGKSEGEERCLTKSLLAERLGNDANEEMDEELILT